MATLSYHGDEVLSVRQFELDVFGLQLAEKFAVSALIIYVGESSLLSMRVESIITCVKILLPVPSSGNKTYLSDPNSSKNSNFNANTDRFQQSYLMKTNTQPITIVQPNLENTHAQKPNLENRLKENNLWQKTLECPSLFCFLNATNSPFLHN